MFVILFPPHGYFVFEVHLMVRENLTLSPLLLVYTNLKFKLWQFLDVLDTFQLMISYCCRLLICLLLNCYLSMF